MSLGDVYILNGDNRMAQEYYKNALSFEKLGFVGPSWFNLLRLRIISVQVMNNEKHIDLKLLYSYVSQNKIRRIEGTFMRYLSQILLHIDEEHISEAENWIKQAIEADKRNGVMFDLGMDYALYAELFKLKEDRSKAKENLGKALDMLKKCGADGWVGRYEKELAEL